MGEKTDSVYFIKMALHALYLRRYETVTGASTFVQENVT